MIRGISISKSIHDRSDSISDLGHLQILQHGHMRGTWTDMVWRRGRYKRTMDALCITKDINSKIKNRHSSNPFFSSYYSNLGPIPALLTITAKIVTKVDTQAGLNDQSLIACYVFYCQKVRYACP